MNTAERLRQVETALSAKRAAVKGFCERYKDAPSLLAMYRRDVRNELRTLARERACQRRITKLEHDLHNAQEKLVSSTKLLSETINAAEQPATNWHDTEVLDRVRIVCKKLGLSAAKPDESIETALNEKGAQIKLLQQELGQATVAKEEAEKRCLELLDANTANNERYSDLKVDLAFANEQAKDTKTALDALTAVVDNIGIQPSGKSIWFDVSKWMIDSKSELGRQQNTICDMRNELDTLRKTKSPDFETLIKSLNPDVHDPLTLAYVRHWFSITPAAMSEHDAYNLLVEIGKPWPKRGAVWQAVVLAGRGTKFGLTPAEASKVVEVQFGKTVMKQAN